ncbi:GNAT family N-acetyltransferase [Halobacillus shinanisalinarum]|uniref:GNAT family N-acetyltransferase n=1 Tax=Halobacillus shinanisalinarum TaxID=2932258 RepID=A0ABY4GUY8_9BACI|nr:GNAT family N-acetyltransferase [Halobacillus shinanisalinarum]UOQ91849.1 GNAT family N-acetyltransferase [Halobacillus shinanisalinarum]
MEFDVRLLTENDLTAASKVFTEVFSSEPWDEPWCYETAYKRFKDIRDTPGYIGIGYFNASGQMIGFLVGNEEQWAKNRNFYINEICVLSDTQQKGIGTGLLEYLRKVLSGKGVSSAYLTTERGLGMPESFFTKNGFYTNESRILMNTTIL